MNRAKKRTKRETVRNETERKKTRNSGPGPLAARGVGEPRVNSRLGREIAPPAGNQEQISNLNKTTPIAPLNA